MELGDEIAIRTFGLEVWPELCAIAPILPAPLIADTVAKTRLAAPATRTFTPRDGMASMARARHTSVIPLLSSD